MEVLIGFNYKHKEKGGRYTVQKFIKGKVNGEWVLGVFYKSLMNLNEYWRPLDDFIANFTPFEECSSEFKTAAATTLTAIVAIGINNDNPKL